MSLKLNSRYLGSFVTEADLIAIEPEVKKAHSLLNENRNEAPGNDFHGWMELPINYDKEEFARIKQSAKKIISDSEVLVVIGIGGSYLGARAAIEFVKSKNYNLTAKGTPKIFFVGNSISPTEISEIYSICENCDFSVNVISKSGTTTEPAIAFRVFKALLEKNAILSYQYSYVDDYYYANDKKSWQHVLGFARIYDIIAPYLVLEYDYTRVFFEYDKKDFMVQLWKGQYGYIFYGGEIGIYHKRATNREAGMLTLFRQAKEEYWPYMEMSVYHQKLNGQYEREFTRDYDKYWWCTGFKPGHLRDVEPADELRIVARLTMNDNEMAKLFAQGLKDCGFGEKMSKDSLGLDEYCLDGKDVYLTWQNISEAENTMPLKLTIAALAFFNVFGLLAAAILIPLGILPVALLFIIL